MRQAKSQNPELLGVIRSLRKTAKANDAPVWRDVADRLCAAKRSRVAVNISRLNRHTKEKETVVVPGKVLGAGRLEHPLIVAAFAFSADARAKITQAKGKCISISQLLEDIPKGDNVRIMG